MKAMIKVAVCGILAAALNTTANAAVIQLEEAAGLALSKTSTGQQVASKLGIAAPASATASEITSKIMALPVGEREQVAAAINSYTKGLVSTNGAAAKVANEKLAASIFNASNFRLTATQAAVTAATSRATVVGAPTVDGPSCSQQQIASDMIAGTKISYADAMAVVQSGAISLGDCAHGLLGVAAQARENAIKIGLYKLQHCPTQGGKVATGDAGNACTVEALAATLSIPADQAAKNVAELRGACHYLN